MPKIGTFPTTVEDCLTISIGDLRRWGYLDATKKGALTWTTNGKTSGSISIYSKVEDRPLFILLLYWRTDRRTGERESISYKVNLTRIPSNLGIGWRYYFLCPISGKRASKLYKPPGGSRFLHRTCWNLIYLEQTRSKYWRWLENSSLGITFKIERLEDRLRNPGEYRKRSYAGKETRWFRRIREQVEWLETKKEIPKEVYDLERLQTIG